jgi:hypothetical protein
LIHLINSDGLSYGLFVEFVRFMQHPRWPVDAAPTDSLDELATGY